MAFSSRVSRFAGGLAALVLLAGSATALAQTNAVPGCYHPLKVAPPQDAPDLEVFVLVDQTTVLDGELRRSLDENLARLLRPGASFQVLAFSAYNQGRYMSVLSAGSLEGQLPKPRRNKVGVQTLRELDRCLAGQSGFGRRLALAALSRGAAGATSTLSRSEIIASLAEASHLVAASRARDKIVIVASDMLENSSFTSFYARGGVRRLDPDAELAKIASHRMFGSFGGARVYVIGAGLLPAPTNGSAETAASNAAYRDSVTMTALNRFWSGYFEQSQARLAAFGQPALLQPVR